MSNKLYKPPTKNKKGVSKNYKDLNITKKKRTVQPLTVSLILVIVVLCVGFLSYAGYKEGWFDKPQVGSITVDDWSTIEVDSADLEVTDEDVDDYIDTFVSYYESDEEETEGTVEDGDTLTITYVGYYDEDGEKGEEFDGGSGEDYELEIGSDEFIDGFEDGLIGCTIGDTVELDLTFPDDYDDEDMAGVDVIFEVTITNRIVTVTPDLTDDFVSEYSEEYWDEQIDTIEDLEEYVYEYYYTEALHSAIETAIIDLMTVNSYDEEDYQIFYDDSYELLDYYAESYGYDIDEFAELYGADDAESYCEDQAEYYCEMTMLMDYFWEELGFEEYTDEEIDDLIYDYMETNGYEEDYTVDEFIEANGEAWYQSYIRYESKADTVYEALEEYVTITGDEDETETSEDGTETETETEAEE